MRLYSLLAALLIAIGSGQAQDAPGAVSQEGEFRATVINAQTQQPLESVHVINLNQVIGTITDGRGEFTIQAAVNDTGLGIDAGTHVTQPDR